MDNFILTGFSDEIASDFIEQLEGMKALNISNIEIRGVNGKNISHLTLDEVKEVKKALEAHEIQVSCIGSPIGKIHITDDFDAHIKVFEHLMAVAEILAVKRMRIFSFYMDESKANDYEEEVIDKLSKLVAIAKEHNVLLLHENEKGIFGDTPERCKVLYDALGSDHFKLIFDPANFIQCGCETYPKAFELLEEGIAYMHIKDALLESGTVVPAGQGDGKIKAILRALKEKSYKGYLSLEPHLGEFEGFNELEQTEDSDEKTALKESSDLKKFKIATEALRQIIGEVYHG